MDVEYVAPCHCTGDEAIWFFEKIFEDRFIEIGVGEVIEVSMF